MPAASANTAVLGVSIRHTSHGAKFFASPELRTACNAAAYSGAYHANMPRKSAKSDGVKPEAPDWFLPEWMKVLRVSQAKLARECDWTPSTMHGIYHGRTSYYRDIVNLIASKLHIQPYELLMPPERAMAFRQFQASAATITTLAHDADAAERKVGTAGR